MTKIHRLLAVASLAMLAASGVAACGDDGGSTGEDGEPPAAILAPPFPTPIPSPAAVPISTPAPEQTSAPALGVSKPTGRAKSVSHLPLRFAYDPLAPELRGINGWINSEPFTLESQRGNVVLIDFWTYTCINCIRTLPYLKDWYAKYADKGLVILGVHTPEFEFEKDVANMTAAIKKFGIEYPVAQDNDFGTWSAYANRSWPAKYLIDKDGNVRYTHFGEGAYAETEEQIRELLGEAGFDVSMIALNTDPEPVRDPNAVEAEANREQTRELFAGTVRNSNSPYLFQSDYKIGTDKGVLYEDPGTRWNHFFFLHGLWKNTEESLIHARETSGYEDYIVLKFFATSVNVVMASTNSEPLQVRITMDDEAVKPDRAGVDVMFDEDGNSYVSVDESRMYRIVDMDDYGGHELKLSSMSPHMEVFVFTFGSYEGGEPTEKSPRCARKAGTRPLQRPERCSAPRTSRNRNSRSPFRS